MPKKIAKAQQNGHRNLRELMPNISDELLKKIEFVDVYEGSGGGDNERSLTIRLAYRSETRTLLEQEVEAVVGAAAEAPMAAPDANQVAR